MTDICTCDATDKSTLALFIQKQGERLGFRAISRKADKAKSGWQLREDTIPYNNDFGAKIGALSVKIGPF
jgi:hypothetical protein